ncbi:MAG: peptidoglycan D,D-transpeptidase FtsI family protein [Lachnospiraceae bacterium]
MPGISAEADQKKSKAVWSKYEKEYIRGSILDRKGNKIAFSQKAGGKRTYVHPKAFANLVGYDSKTYSTAGLEKTFDKELTYSENSSGENKTGCNVTLTIDSELQTKAYELLEGNIGSCVVLDAKTGEILALASTPSYNNNELEKNWEEIANTDGMLLSNAFQNPSIPGSIFKIISAATILDSGFEEDIVEDEGFLKVEGRKVHNASKAAYGSLTLREGFIHSSNVYFMTEILKIGPSMLEKNAKQFLLGENIELDFCTLRSNFDLGNYSDLTLAMTAFGQGETLVTPLHMAMITQAISNDGKMLKPYLIKEIHDGKKAKKTGKREVLTEATTKEIANKISDIMKDTGNEYGIYVEGYEDLKVAAKTGTAQRGNGTNNAWMVSYAPADNPEYIVCMNHLKTDEAGISLKKDVASIYQKLYRINKKTE